MCVHISLDTPDQQDIRIILYYYTGYLVMMSSGALRSDWKLTETGAEAGAREKFVWEWGVRHRLQ